MTEYYRTDLGVLYCGDVLDVARALADESVNCVVTSPPYWGLRDYGVDGQIGLEPTSEQYVATMVEVFREVKRVLREDGTLWLNLGDTYGTGTRADRRPGNKLFGENTAAAQNIARHGGGAKQLIGIPWRVAFALQADGWYLRQDIIWHKPNPMPESVTDRCTKAHEYVFLMAKSERYYYDIAATKEKTTGNAHARGNGVNPKAIKVPSGWDTDPGSHGTIHRQGRGTGKRYKVKQNESFSASVVGLVEYRNRRSVWTIPTAPCTEAHFATFPPELITPCIRAGCPVDGTVYDPFFGAGTTGMVAQQLGRRWIGSELNSEYCAIARKRIRAIDAIQLPSFLTEVL